jgi:hypothetical protein
MDAWRHFDTICKAMADPACYPHPVDRVERRDTHISAVFLTGSWAYKVKKPVDFGFLDFRTLSARRHFCEREVALNRRFTRDIYQGLVAVRRDASGRLTLDGAGETVEFAVKMVQLPEEHVLKESIRTGCVSLAEMDTLGRHLAGFYVKAERNPQIARYGEPEVIAVNVNENFRQVQPYASRLAGEEKLAFLRTVSHAFLERQGVLFQRRLSMGRICDGHGDLRSDHIYFYQGIQIIDCIEFNDRFRFGDVAVDLAYLYMDLDHRGHAALGRAFLSAYADAASDPEIYVLLDFYAAYRAMVMVKVHCLRWEEEPAEGPLGEVLMREARRYLAQAYRYAIQFSRPMVWVFCGLPATGKSTLARAVAQALGLVCHHSDVLRKELLGIAPQQPQVVPFGAGGYRPGVTARVYGRLLGLAQDALHQGRSVILDATFALRKWRREAMRLAEDLDAGLLFVECRCAEEVQRSRLKQRSQEAGVSDARLEHLPQLLSHFEPMSDLSPELHLAVDTEPALSRVLSTLLSEAYAHRCVQVKRLLE